MPLTDWAIFFAAEVGASAALVGLVTVAISINLARILAFEHLPARAGESLLALTASLVICSVALFPGLPAPALGCVALALSVVTFMFGARNHLSSLKQPWAIAIERQVIGGAARIGSMAPIAAGALMLLFHAPAGLTWIAAGVVVTLAVSVMNAWVLLVEIMR